jgi:vacuolar-type H+-ATPase subunit I/STV1
MNYFMDMRALKAPGAPVEEVAPVAPVARMNRRQQRLNRSKQNLQKLIDEKEKELAKKKERHAEEARKLAAKKQFLEKYGTICNYFDETDDFCCREACVEGTGFCAAHS